MSTAELLSYYDREFVDKAEIKKLTEENEHFLWSFIQERAHSLRADAISKLASHNAITNSRGWALFYTGGGEEDGSVDTIDNPKTVLLLSTVSDQPGIRRICMPVIRIMTNEPVLVEGMDPVWICEDYSLDDDDTSMHCFGATDGSDVVVSPSSLFFIDDGELVVTKNYRPLTPFFEVVTTIKGETKSVHPQGEYFRAEDNIFALTAGNRLLQEIVELEPIGVCSGPMSGGLSEPA